MPKTASLQGKFSISNYDGLRKRMDRLQDGRLHFYEAMLKADTCEDYLERAGTGRDLPKGRKDGPFGAEQEFRYALKRGWISL